MKINLRHRHYGIHTLLRSVEIDGDFKDYYHGEDNINEDLLIKNIPSGFLPCDPSRILITVGNEYSSTGQCVSKFRTWAKYFDSYVLELLEDEDNEKCNNCTNCSCGEVLESRGKKDEI